MSLLQDRDHGLISHYDVFKVGNWDGLCAAAAHLPTPGALTGPTSLTPVAVWLDVPCLEIPDTDRSFRIVL